MIQSLSMEKFNPQILIVDLGSQYTEIIRRSLRYLGFRSTIISPEKFSSGTPPNLKGIILSGGSASVYDINAPKIPKEILDLGVPILGICYGMQWLAYINDHDSVHKVKEGKSYGPVEVTLNKSKLFENLAEKNNGKINAWSSHGDSVKKVPNDFNIIATSKDGQ